jgi:hypothetical protein
MEHQSGESGAASSAQTASMRSWLKPVLIGGVQLHAQAVRAVGHHDRTDPQSWYRDRVPEVRPAAKSGFLRHRQAASGLLQVRHTDHPPGNNVLKLRKIFFVENMGVSF